MREYLPYEVFNWLKNVDEFDVMSVSECNSIEENFIGYFLEVDLKYPNKLNELDSDYPLALEKLAVSSNMLSKYCKKIEIEVGDVKN